MEQLTLRVTGMHCGACENRIQKALSRLDGVRRSAADHRKEEVRVAFDSGRTSLDAIRDAIERADYRVAGVAGTGTEGAPGGTA
jgi:copper chaperone CopZ